MNTQDKKVLVLFDGSQRSRQTVEQVARMEPFKKTGIVLFQVFTEFPENCWDLTWDKNNLKTAEKLNEWRKRMTDESSMYLETARKALINAGFDAGRVSTKFFKQQSDIAMDILAEARQGYHAVLMRRRGMSNIPGVILGSVSSRLLSKLADMPILLVGKRSSSKKILIGIDGSPSSTQAVNFVAGLYSGHGYTVELFHVIRSSKSDFMPTDILEEHKKKITGVFAELKSILVAAGFGAGDVVEKIVTGVPSRSEAIVAEAETEDFGAIVVGRRGLSRVQEFFMGRVCNKVIHRGRDFSVWVI